jgi:hypothetical protein
MSSVSATQRGRRAALLSVGLGILALASWYVIVRTPLFTRGLPPEWLWVGAFTIAGLIGLLGGLIATFRGRGLTRLAGAVGILLNLLAVVVGTLPLWFRLPPVLGTGPFA